MAEDKAAILDRAQKYLQKGYLDKAAAEYKKIVERDPQDVAQRLRLGDLYVKLNKKEDAVKEYGEVAKVYAQKGFYLKAIAVYKQILKLDETILDIHFKLADLYGRHKLIADAIAEYSFLVSFYEKKNKTDEVVNYLKKMLEMDPNNIGTRLKLADIWYKRGYKNEAYGEYDIAVSSLFASNNIDKAEKVLTNLYESDSKEPMVLERLANVYRLKGEDARFAQMFRELAKVYNELGLIDKRNDAYKKVLEVFPHDKESLDVLIEIEKPAPPPQIEVKAEEVVPPFLPEVEARIEAPQIEPQPEEEVVIEVEEEKPLIEFPSVEVGAEAVSEEALPKVEEIKKEAERPLISVGEVLEVSPPKEGAPLEEKVEEAEVIEEMPVIEEVEELEEAEKPLEAVEAVAPEKETVLESKIIEAITKEAKPEEFVDLSKELGLEESLDSLTGAWAKAEGKGGEETFIEFKKGVEKQLTKEDSETHYNLGIAYMEMGLYDDAIREFKVAIKDTNLEFDCYARLGLISIAAGEVRDAVGYFLKGLKVEGHSLSERKGLMYELASAYEMAGDIEEALGIFKSIQDIDLNFRGVREKIEELTVMIREGPHIPLADDMIEVELL